jgi:uncharacterized membrane protein YhhN
MLLKVSGVVILAAVAFASGGPWLLGLALAASAIGDAFLAGKPERWLVPGMAAFFLAHIFYVVLFWSLRAADVNVITTVLQTILVLGGAAYIFFLSPSLGALRGPVIAYGCVILIMGAAALALPAAYWLTTAGAMMFIASDALLANELFRRPAGAEPRKLPSVALWLLYFFGQAAILIGLLGPLL